MLYARCYKISAQFSCLSQHTKVFNPIVWRGTVTWQKEMSEKYPGKNHHHLLQQFFFLSSVFCPPASVLDPMLTEVFHPSEIGKILIEKMDPYIIYCQTFGAKSYFRNFSQNVWRFAFQSASLPAQPLSSNHPVKFDSLDIFRN